MKPMSKLHSKKKTRGTAVDSFPQINFDRTLQKARELWKIINQDILRQYLPSSHQIFKQTHLVDWENSLELLFSIMIELFLIQLCVEDHTPIRTQETSEKSPSSKASVFEFTKSFVERLMEKLWPGEELNLRQLGYLNKPEIISWMKEDFEETPRSPERD